MSGRASLEKRREHNRRWQAKTLADGRCKQCGKPRAYGDKFYCWLCRVKQRRFLRRYSFTNRRVKALLATGRQLFQFLTAVIDDRTTIAR